MYQYDFYDTMIVNQRVIQFRDQIDRSYNRACCQMTLSDCRACR